MVTLYGIKSKSEYESVKLQQEIEEKKRKNLLILIFNYMISCGFSQTALKLIEESKIDLEAFEKAENINLMVLITDYETYFEQRYNTKPVFYKEIINYNKDKDQKKKQKSLPSIKKCANEIPEANKKKPEELKLEVINLNDQVQIKKKENLFKIPTFTERREKILLKPLPDSLLTQELKELAAIVKNEIILENTNIDFDDVIGFEDVKETIKQSLLYPLKYPDLIEEMPWRGILLFGPPGTGKVSF